MQEKNIFPDRSSTTAVILAGGRAKRMGFMDKGLLPFRGLTMVKHVIHRLKPQVDRIMISANQNQEQYAQWGMPVYPDERTGYAGPLAGMETGLHHCQTLYMVTVPCDTPFLPDDLVLRLSETMHEKNADITVAATGVNDRCKPQPVFCLMKTALLPGLKSFLDSGQGKIDSWYATLQFSYTFFPDESTFRNINTQEELQTLESMNQTI